MRNIYFVQPNSLLGNSIYYPYAVGVIAAYAFQFEEIRDHYSLGGIIFKEDPFSDVFAHLDDPFLVAFSNYAWNYRYNLELAAQIKTEYPQCLIVFGGHQVTNDTRWLEENPDIDILIHGEGEAPFTQLLTALLHDTPLLAIPNLAVRQKDGSITQTEKRFVGIEDYPSPYSSGIFDKLLSTCADLEFNAQLETNRGCPYHCSFCDWCSYDVPMRLFPEERIKADLEWISSHKITYCMCVDSNFGLLERDESIAQFIVDLKQRTGYPEKFGACFAKNKTDRIFRINKMFNANGLSKGASLAFQSMSEEVLKNVSRSNMNKDKLSEQLALYHDAGIPTYTELILGLPGETYESFCMGVCELLDLGQHDSINVYRCEIYPNSDLADAKYMKKFGIKTALNKMNLNHCRISDAVFSGGFVFIAETSSMKTDALIDAHLFSCCVQSLHCHGLLQFLAIYLHYANGVSYYRFYHSFFQYFLEKDGLIGETLRKIKRSMYAAANSTVDFSYINPAFGDLTWPYEEAVLLEFLFQKEMFYAQVTEFLSMFAADPVIMEELLRFQKNMLVTPGQNDVRQAFGYAFSDFFDAAIANTPRPLEKKDCVLHLYAPDAPLQWEKYARQIVWYGRRNKEMIRKAEVVTG